MSNNEIKGFLGEAKDSKVVKALKVAVPAVGGACICIAGGYLIGKHVNLAGVAKTVADAAPEVADAVVETAEAIL